MLAITVIDINKVTALYLYKYTLLYTLPILRIFFMETSIYLM